MGELHLEVIKHRLLRDFNLDVRVHKPRVSYKETVANSAEALGRCQRQVGGQALFAEVKVRVTPRHDNKPAAVFTNWFTEDSTVRTAMAIIMSSLQEHSEGGGLLGCPLWDCAIELLEHPFPDPMPPEVALRIAAADAFTKVLEAAGVVLLEPIMALEVTTPEDHLGDVINDLQQRRAIITSTEARGAITVVDAEAPLASMFGYSAAVRSLSQGRATLLDATAEIRARANGSPRGVHLAAAGGTALNPAREAVDDRRGRLHADREPNRATVDAERGSGGRSQAPMAGGFRMRERGRQFAERWAERNLGACINEASGRRRPAAQGEGDHRAELIAALPGGKFMVRMIGQPRIIDGLQLGAVR